MSAPNLGLISVSIYMLLEMEYIKISTQSSAVEISPDLCILADTEKVKSLPPADVEF